MSIFSGQAVVVVAEDADISLEIQHVDVGVLYYT
jgi:hypothetical protein